MWIAALPFSLLQFLVFSLTNKPMSRFVVSWPHMLIAFSSTKMTPTEANYFFSLDINMMLRAEQWCSRKGS